MSTSDRTILNRKTAALFTLLALVLPPAAVAVAQTTTGIGAVTSFHAAFTTSRTDTASGLTLKTTGRPLATGETEAPAVQQIVTLPAGTELRLASLPQCMATDALIASVGAEAACPARARVGTGGADGLLAGARVHFDVGIYAVRGHLVFAAEQGGRPLKQAFDGLAKGRRLILTVPTLGGRIQPIVFHARISARPGGRTWLLTPPRCPASGHWTASGRFRGVAAPSAGAPQVGTAQTRTADLACMATSG